MMRVPPRIAAALLCGEHAIDRRARNRVDAIARAEQRPDNCAVRVGITTPARRIDDGVSPTLPNSAPARRASSESAAKAGNPAISICLARIVSIVHYLG